MEDAVGSSSQILVIGKIDLNTFFTSQLKDGGNTKNTVQLIDLKL